MNHYLICVVHILDVSSGMFVIVEACVRTKYEIFRWGLFSLWKLFAKDGYRSGHVKSP